MYRVPVSAHASALSAARARVHAVEVNSALQVVAELLAGPGSDELNASDVERGLRARESVSPTNVGSGIAMPHFIDTKVRLGRIVAVTLVSPISWGTGRDPVDIVFGLSGTPAEPWRHVRSLAHLARVSSGPGFADLLRTASDDGTLMRLFTEEATRHG